MSHILVPTDFSANSLNACRYALDLFGRTGHRFTLLNCYMDPLPPYPGMGGMGATLYEASMEGMTDFAVRFRALDGMATADVKTEVVYGMITGAIEEICRSRSVDFIVMGTQGATAGSIFGSNASAVAKSSRVPVLIVPHEAHFNGLRHVLLADDHTEIPARALDPIVSLARVHGSDVAIAHVRRNDSEEPHPQVVAAYDQLLSAVKHRYIDGAGDDVALALSNVAERDLVDLVVVLHRHVGALEGLFHASVAKQLALHTRIPLLVLEQ